MFKQYHKKAKKSILWLLVVIFFALTSFAPVLAVIPNDLSFNDQASFYNQINLPETWDISVGSRSVVVAVIDIGVDVNHPDLTDNIWQNLDEIPNNKLDDDNNGFIDDVNGWNFVENNNNVGVPELNFTQDASTVSHGTMSAGIIGAVGNNNLDGVGVNWRVSLMAIRAMGNSGIGSFGNVANAIDYAVDNGADIISLSIVGYENNSEMIISIEKANKAGVFIAGAVGNERLNYLGDLDANPTYPTCMDVKETDNYIMGVTSVNLQDKLSSFANYGVCVDISAPGQAIKSTLYYEPKNNYSKTFGGNGNGTSYAVPFVAGAAALLKSVAPSWNNDKLTTVLKQSSDSLNSLNVEFKNKMGAGRLNINKAMQVALGDDSFLATSYDFLYFSDGRNIYSFQPKNKEKYLIARVNGAKLIGFSTIDVDQNGSTEVVMLIQRGDYYYVRTVTGDGTFISEIFLTEEKLASFASFDLFKDGKNVYMVLEKVTDKNKELLKYDLKGKKIDSLVLGNIDKWAMNNKDQIVTAKLQGDKLSLQIIDWFGKLQDSLEFEDVEQLYTLEVGDVRKGGRVEQVVLVKRQNQMQLLIVDIPIKSWLRTKIANYDPVVNWRFMIGSRGGVILPYTTVGGKFTLLKDGNRWLGQINLPELEEGEILKTESF